MMNLLKLRLRIQNGWREIVRTFSEISSKFGEPGNEVGAKSFNAETVSDPEGRITVES